MIFPKVFMLGPRVFMLRLRVFIKALFFHVYAGFPKSTQAEILSRYCVCLQCDKLNIEKSECTVCGCSLGIKSQFFNKLAWADQECPIGKWSKLDHKK